MHVGCIVVLMKPIANSFIVIDGELQKFSPNKYTASIVNRIGINQPTQQFDYEAVDLRDFIV